MSRNLNTWDVLNESGTDEVQCSGKVASGRRVAGAIRSLVDIDIVLGSCMVHSLCSFYTWK